MLGGNACLWGFEAACLVIMRRRCTVQPLVTPFIIIFVEPFALLTCQMYSKERSIGADLVFRIKPLYCCSVRNGFASIDLRWTKLAELKQNLVRLSIRKTATKIVAIPKKNKNKKKSILFYLISI